MSTRMLVYKAWLDTRWRFVIGLCVVMLAAVGCVLAYPRTLEVMHAIERNPGGLPVAIGSSTLSDQLAQTLQLAGTYRGFIWSQLFHNELPQLWCLFAIMIGSGGIVSQAARGEGVFTLSLPVSRRQLAIVRAGVGLVELLALAVIPAALLPIVSPVVQQSYSVGDALVHALFLFGGGTVFFALTFFLSSLLEQFWAPLVVMLLIASLITFARALVPGLSAYSLAPILTAEGYFRGTGLPWLGLAISLVVAAGLIVLATRNIARRDF